MASFRKRQNKWQARIQRKGFPDITKSFSQFSVASQWARKIERELDLGNRTLNITHIRKQRFSEDIVLSY